MGTMIEYRCQQRENEEQAKLIKLNVLISVNAEIASLLSKLKHVLKFLAFFK